MRDRFYLFIFLKSEREKREGREREPEKQLVFFLSPPTNSPLLSTPPFLPGPGSFLAQPLPCTQACSTKMLLSRFHLSIVRFNVETSLLRFKTLSYNPRQPLHFALLYRLSLPLPFPSSKRNLEHAPVVLVEARVDPFPHVPGQLVPVAAVGLRKRDATDAGPSRSEDFFFDASHREHSTGEGDLWF